MSNYSVGQILFLIANNKVVPVQVIEEVIRTTLEGKEKTYIVKFPDKDGTTSDIKKLKSELFDSPKSIKKFMIDNATKAIEDMLYICEEMSVSAFGKTYNEVGLISSEKNDIPTEDYVDVLESKMQPGKTNSIITVDLGNGKYGKINTSEFEKAGSLE